MKYTLFNKIIRYTKKLSEENIGIATCIAARRSLDDFLAFCCEKKCITPGAYRFLKYDMLTENATVNKDKMLLLCSALGMSVSRK